MAVDESIEVLAPSVEEAIIIGLTRMVVTRDEVEIEVLDEGGRGFLGIGAREARVRLTQVERRLPEAQSDEPELVQPPMPAKPPTVEEHKVVPSVGLATPSKRAEPAEAVEAPSVKAPQPEQVAIPPEPAAVHAALHAPSDGLDRERLAEIARETMSRMLPGLEITTTVEWVDEDRPTLWVSLSGKDADVLVGPRARNLHSVQYLFRALIYRRLDGDYNVVVDADGYRRRRRRSLESTAQEKADQAVEQGQTVRLRAMPPHERRIVHMTLRGDERVSTASVGKGRDRAVTIVPNKK